MNREQTQNAPTVTSCALRLNGGPYMDDAILASLSRGASPDRPDGLPDGGLSMTIHDD